MANINRFKVGDYIKCNCGSNCQARGKITGYSVEIKRYVILMDNGRKETVGIERAVKINKGG